MMNFGDRHHNSLFAAEALDLCWLSCKWGIMAPVTEIHTEIHHRFVMSKAILGTCTTLWTKIPGV